MPIDPKKFEKIITDHFENLTEEEFLKTLQKSSPYLFDESLEIDRDVSPSNRDEITSFPANDNEFFRYLSEEAYRMKSNNIDPITIGIYTIRMKLIYALVTIFQSVILLTNKITNAFTKRA